jgi:Na+-translocating ferredoxin:NAD+ oxidoreductase subunit D
MKRARSLVVGPAPYTFRRQTTASLMWGTIATLAPALCWSLFCFGSAAAFPVLCSIGSALVGEAIVGWLSGRFTLGDGSAFLTGLLIGMAMPPGVPLYIPMASSLFAILVIKNAFGGLGSNWMNPALGGVAFALLDWPRAMGNWILPRQLAAVGAVSGATPLALLRTSLAAAPAGSDTLSILALGGAHVTDFDRSVTDALNRGLFSHLGADLPSGYIDLLVGNRPGAIGEISALLIIAASVILISRRMIRWEIPASIMSCFALLEWIFGGLPLGNGFFAGDVLFALCTGSFLLVAFFMATDPVTSPSSKLAMLVYGSGVGFATFLFRVFGSSPEGSAFAVLIMNCFVPLLERRIGLSQTADSDQTRDLDADAGEEDSI